MVSIHAPYAGSDHQGIFGDGAYILFQSTPPMQGATEVRDDIMNTENKFQSTPPMQGATLMTLYVISFLVFQSTPPMQGATVSGDAGSSDRSTFQSTPPMQGATALDDMLSILFSNVSIHAPYAGSDWMIPPLRKYPRCFNPRPLCRERPVRPFQADWIPVFQSTPPMQGATVTLTPVSACNTTFQSTPPMQGATL